MDECVYIYILDYSSSAVYRSKMTKHNYNLICSQYDGFDNYLEEQGYKKSECSFMVSNEETDITDIKFKKVRPKYKYLYVLDHINSTLSEIDIETEDTDNFIYILESYGLDSRGCSWIPSEVKLEITPYNNK